MLVLNDMTADARVDREACALARAGHQVDVLALRNEGLPPVEERERYTIRRVAEYTKAPWRKPFAKLAESHNRTEQLKDAAVELRPDVVHCHDSDTLPAGERVLNVTKARLVYDAHELYPDMLAEYGMRGSWAVQQYWRSVERQTVPKADAVITVSDALSRELALRYQVIPVVVRNVPRLTPLRRTGRLHGELDLDSETPVVLYQGVLTPGRGLRRLVQAMANVPEAVLAIQGFGPEANAMESEAGRLDLADRVRMMGRIPQDELHEYACDATLGVVIYERTTLNNYLAAPNKLFAYLMAGLPVAASDFPGLAEVVNEGVGGLFDPADASSIASTLNGLLADRQRLKAMSERARALAETRYNWDVEKEKLLAVYEALAARSTS